MNPTAIFVKGDKDGGDDKRYTAAMFEAGTPERGVWDELKAVRVKGIGHLDAPPTKNKDLVATPLLEQAAGTLPDYSVNSTRAEAIRRLVETEIPNVTDALARAWLPASFGLTKETQGKSPTECRRVATRIAGATSQHNFGRSYGQEQTGLGMLAVQIVADCLNSRASARPYKSSVPQAESSPQAASANPRYVPRQGLQERFNYLASSGAKLIIIYGFPGMGKSWFAQSLVTDAPVIAVANGNISSGDLQVALINSGIDVRRYHVTDTHERLAVLLCDEQAPQYVILDGLDSADELIDLLPRNARSIIVATCRNKGENPPDTAKFIKVSNMSPDEAAAMVRQNLPELSEAEITQLAKALDNYPLALRYACRLVDEQGISVAQFCNDLAPNLESSAGRMRTGDSRPLLTVLENIVAKIDSIDPLAVALLLAVACCVADPVIGKAYLWRWVNTILKWNGRLDLAPTRFAEAMDILDQYALVDTQYNKDEERVFTSGRIHMHALTAQLIRDYFVGDDIGEIAFYLTVITYGLEGDEDEGLHEKMRHIALARAFTYELEGGTLRSYIDPERLTSRLTSKVLAFEPEIWDYLALFTNVMALAGLLLIDDGFDGAANRFDPLYRRELQNFLNANSLSSAWTDEDGPIVTIAMLPERWHTQLIQMSAIENQSPTEQDDQ